MYESRKLFLKALLFFARFCPSILWPINVRPSAIHLLDTRKVIQTSYAIRNIKSFIWKGYKITIPQKCLSCFTASVLAFNATGGPSHDSHVVERHPASPDLHYIYDPAISINIPGSPFIETANEQLNSSVELHIRQKTSWSILGFWPSRVETLVKKTIVYAVSDQLWAFLAKQMGPSDYQVAPKQFLV
jgi:hypothetical protein